MRFAHPVRNTVDDWIRPLNLSPGQEHAAEGFVVGVPRNMDGSMANPPEGCQVRPKTGRQTAHVAYATA